MFDRRVSDGIFFVCNPGESTHTVRDGDSVTLHIGDELVLVNEVLALGNRTFKGVVLGFQPSYALEFEGLRPGQEIEFSEEQVFACSRP